MTAPAAGLDRRTLLRGLAAAVALAATSGLPRWALTPAAAAVTDDPVVATLEAFADTLIPGQKRAPDDRAVAGAVAGPGAVQAGAIALLQMPEAQVAAYLPAVAGVLDAAAMTYAARAGLVPDPTVPPLVALGFADRTALCGQLLATGQPVGQTQQALTLFALLVFVAFHCAGHLHTAEALAQGHPGLAWLRFPAPGADGLYRYPDFSYRRVVADAHPATTPSGSPA